MNNSVGVALIFLVKVIFGFFILLLFLRLLFDWQKVGKANPFYQLTFKLTEPVAFPLRRFIPRFYKFDLVLVILLVVAEILKHCLMIIISQSYMPNIIGLIIVSLATLLNLLINIFFYAILLDVILSWINPTRQNDLMEVLDSLTLPLLVPVRRYIPYVSGLDLSPLVVLVLLKLTAILFVMPIAQLGATI